MRVSLLVPAFNEEENIPILLENVKEFIEKNNLDWEVIIVDDGSQDRTYEIAANLKREYPFLKIARHPFNMGKTHALLTASQIATGDIFVIYDADMQFTLEDALKLIKKLENEGYDIVAGWKVGKYEKKMVSTIYNLLSRWLFKIPVHDMNAMKAIKKEVFENISLRKDWHRYIIPLASNKGYKIGEEPVILKKRMYGKSKYSSVGRILIGFLDLLSVKFQMSFTRKPMLFFGSLGLLSFLLGIITGLIALYLRYIRHIGFRPLLYLVILLILSGLILFISGFLGELIAGLHDRVERLEEITKKDR